MADFIASRFIEHTVNNNPYSLLTYVFTHNFRLLSDRLDYFSNYCPYNLYKYNLDINNYKTMNLPSMSAIIDNRGLNIKNRALNGEMFYVLWSGGVDSTTMIASMLKNDVPKESYTILCNTKSVMEYESLYNELKNRNCNIVCGGIEEPLRVRENRTQLTGSCGDELFQSVELDNSLEDATWEDGIVECLTNRGKKLTKYDKDKLLEIYFNYYNNIGLDIVTYKEYSWLFNIFNNYTYVVNQLKLFDSACTDISTTNNLLHESFFDTDEFNAWSIQNYKELNNYSNNANNYKLPFKNYILDYFDDNEYFITKNKVYIPGKLKDYWNKDICILDTDGLHVHEYNEHNVKHLAELYIKD